MKNVEKEVKSGKEIDLKKLKQRHFAFHLSYAQVTNKNWNILEKMLYKIPLNV